MFALQQEWRYPLLSHFCNTMYFPTFITGGNRNSLQQFFVTSYPQALKAEIYCFAFKGIGSCPGCVCWFLEPNRWHSGNVCLAVFELEMSFQDLGYNQRRQQAHPWYMQTLAPLVFNSRRSLQEDYILLLNLNAGNTSSVLGNYKARQGHRLEVSTVASKPDSLIQSN